MLAAGLNFNTYPAKGESIHKPLTDIFNARNVSHRFGIRKGAKLQLLTQHVFERISLGQ
jgi:hypothetical protein